MNRYKMHEPRKNPIEVPLVIGSRVKYTQDTLNDMYTVAEALRVARGVIVKEISEKSWEVFWDASPWPGNPTPVLKHMLTHESL